MPVFEITLDDGRVLEIDAVDQAAALAGVEHFRAQEAVNTPSTGFLDAVQQGVANFLGGLGETDKQFVGTGAADALQRWSSAVAPENYQPAEVVTKDGVNLSQLPRAVVEQSPTLAATITAGRLGSRIHPLVGLAAAGLTGAAVSLGGQAKNRAVAETGDPNAEPTAGQKAIAAVGYIPQGILDAIGARRFFPGVGASSAVGAKGVAAAGGRAVTTAGVEGATEGAQNVIEQVARTAGTPGGLRVDPIEAANEAIVGAAAGGSFATPRAVSDVAGAVKFREFGGDLRDASASVANRIEAAAGGQSLKSPKTGFQAIRSVESDLKTELNDAARDLKNQVKLTPEAQNALKRAQTGRSLTEGDIAAVDSAVEGAANADLVRSLVRQAAVLNKLKTKGDYAPRQGRFAGGLGNKLERHVRALQNPIGAGTAGTLASLGLSGNMAAMFTAAPPALAAIGGAYGGARMIDYLTGARSPAQQFTERFADPSAALRPDVIQPEPPPASPPPPPSSDGPWGARPPGPSVPSVPLKTPDLSKPPAGFESLLQSAVRDMNRDTRREQQEIQALLRKLAARYKVQKAAPAPVEFDPLVLPADMIKRAKSILSGAKIAMEGREKAQAEAEAEAEKAQKAAPAPAEFDPLALPADMIKRAKSILSGAKIAMEGREKAQAEAEAETSPLLEQLVGGLEGVPTPDAGKRISQILSHARALAKLRSDPEAEAAAKEAERAEREAAKAAERAKKEAAKAAERAEREAAKAAERAKKEAAKAAEREAKEAAKVAERAEKAVAREAARGAKRAPKRPPQTAPAAPAPVEAPPAPIEVPAATMAQATAPVTAVTKTNGKEPKLRYDPNARRIVKTPSGIELSLRRHSGENLESIEELANHIADNLESRGYRYKVSREDFLLQLEPQLEAKAQLAGVLNELTGIDEFALRSHVWALSTKAEARQFREDLKRAAPDAADAIDALLTETLFRQMRLKDPPRSKKSEEVKKMAKTAKVVAKAKETVAEKPAPAAPPAQTDPYADLDIPPFLRRTR